MRDDRVAVVGKTGTAYPVEKGSYNLATRRYAFAGFFPYEAPKYSCMALVLGPSGTSANRTSGQVVKNLAGKMVARGMLNNSSTYSGTKVASQPVLCASDKYDHSHLIASLGISKARKAKDVAAQDSAYHDIVPNVVGYDAPTAVRILEERGLNVVLKGTGRVVSQSIPRGAAVRNGGKIVLNLKI